MPNREYDAMCARFVREGMKAKVAKSIRDPGVKKNSPADRFGNKWDGENRDNRDNRGTPKVGY